MQLELCHLHAGSPAGLQIGASSPGPEHMLVACFFSGRGSTYTRSNYNESAISSHGAFFPSLVGVSPLL